MLLFEATTEFDRQLKAKFGHKEEIYRFLKTHPMRDIALNHLSDQILRFEHRFKRRIDIHRRNSIVAQFLELFCKQALDAKEEELKSEAAQYDKIRTDPIEDEIDSMIHEVNDREDQSL